MFEDEARFGRMSRPLACWAPLGTRSEVKTQRVREYDYAFGAVAPLTGQMDSLVLPRCDTEMMRIFLAEVSQWQRGSAGVMRELREIRIDIARSSDELSNITKFFGDWHLARIYQNISACFHLSDWHHTIDEKLKTLDNLYQLLNEDRNSRWMRRWKSRLCCYSSWTWCCS